MKWLGLLFMGLMLGGCATEFWGTAPASPGKVYVAGSKAGERTIWLCPLTAGEADCTPVEISD
jgi:hypothetical protein